MTFGQRWVDVVTTSRVHWVRENADVEPCPSHSLSPVRWHRSVRLLRTLRGWSGGATVLGKLPVPGRPTIWITVGQGPTALAVGAGGGCLDIFTLICSFSPLSLSLFGRRSDID